MICFHVRPFLEQYCDKLRNWEKEHVTSEGRKSVNQGALVSFYKQRAGGRKKSSAQSLKTRFILTHKDGSQPRSSVLTGTASTVLCTCPPPPAAAAAETVQHAEATEEASVKTLFEPFGLLTNCVFSNSVPCEASFSQRTLDRKLHIQIDN